MIENAMEVNAPVRAIEVMEDKLLVGGEFTQTAPQIMDGSVNQLNTRYLAYWNDEVENWETEFDGVYTKVNAIGDKDGTIVVGGEVSPPDYNGFEQPGVSFLVDNIWEDWTLYQSDTLEGDGLIHGFFNFNEDFYTYGDVFNKEVRAVEEFQNEVYFAGDFSEVSTGWGGSNGVAVNGIVRSPLTGVSAVEGNFITKQIQIYHSSGKLYVNYEALENKTALNIYNLQGQILQTINLQKGAAREIFDLTEMTDGMYVYQIINKDGQQSGKFAKF